MKYPIAWKIIWSPESVREISSDIFYRLRANISTLRELNKVKARALDYVEGLLAIPNGLAIPNTHPLMTNTDSLAFLFHL